MEYYIQDYYKQKRRKKKVNKIKASFGIIVFFSIIFFSKNQILKSNSSKIYDLNVNEKSNMNNTENISVIINNSRENIIESKEENKSNVNDKINNKNQLNNIEQKEIWKTVSDDYFKDAIFIGDSRTEGFILNNGLTSKTISYAHKGLTVDTIFTDKVINMNGKKLTIIEALNKTKFSKVYIMLGINETGWKYKDMFINKYTKIIDEIKKINPKCTIYVESIIPVTEKVSNEHKYIKNAKIEEYNSLIKKMAKEKDIYYLNIQDWIINQNGTLPEDAATDGIHLNRKYCEKWLKYLKNHAIGE